MGLCVLCYDWYVAGSVCDVITGMLLVTGSLYVILYVLLLVAGTLSVLFFFLCFLVSVCDVLFRASLDPGVGCVFTFATWERVSVCARVCDF